MMTPMKRFVNMKCPRKRNAMVKNSLPLNPWELSSSWSLVHPSACSGVRPADYAVVVVSTNSHISEQGKKGSAQGAPVLPVSSLVIAEEVVAHDAKEEHEDEQEEKKVENRTAECLNESCDQDLESLQERYEP